MYIAHERRAYILRLLQQRGSLRSSELAEELGVTNETIRTDLVALQAQGLLQREHGGARYCFPSSTAPEGSPADAAAQRVLPHLRPGMLLYCEDSPLCDAVLRLCRASLCIITPSPALLLRLAAAALPHRLLCPGGELDKESALLQGTELPWNPELALLAPPAVLPRAIAYRSAAAARWAELAARAAADTLILAPATALREEAPDAPHRVSLLRARLMTEDALPPAFADSAYRIETVPLLNAATLRQAAEGYGTA
ncbi:MAG: DeoR family transcriptional regulator [Akkermansia sp.]